MLNHKARPAAIGRSRPSCAIQSVMRRARQYSALTKPGITGMAVFCALIGMLLATSGVPDWRRMAWAAAGIWLMTGAAFALNCLFEADRDARMARTARRATAAGELGRAEVGAYASLTGAAGMWALYSQVNSLTMWLTLATFFGYAVVYTVFLKPRTSQNIVIGGLPGAMPPALGWAAMTDGVPLEAWLLVLILFMWTPPHFWALAMYRREDYARAGLPMLPVTHGLKHTGLQVWLYTIGLAAVTALPWAAGMSGLPYLAAAAVLNAVFIRHGWKLYRQYSDQLARKTFGWSIVYLALLFLALLIDHYSRF